MTSRRSPQMGILGHLFKQHHQGHRMRTLLLATLIVAAYADGVRGQVPSQFGEYEVVGASYRKFVLPGEASIKVLVLGNAGASGIYELGRQVDMGELLALSSVELGAVTPRERREVSLRLYRETGTERTVVYEAKLEDFLAYPGQYPQLQDKDVMVVETVIKQRFGWRDALSIVTGIAAVALAVDRLRDATR